MRRLTAYKEQYSQSPSSATFGRLTIVEKYRVSTTSSSLVLAFRFQYNYTKYAVVLSKEGGAALDATNLTGIGVATDEVVINVEMKKYKKWIATAWYLEQSIAAYVASITGMQIISRSFSGTTTTTVIDADTAATQKQVTSIANVNATYLNSVTASTTSKTVYSTVTTQYNFFDLDLDDKTAIGISYQGFNPEAPDQIGFKYSNSFSIPRTANNDKLTGFGGNSDDVYLPWFVNYIVDNEKVISSGKIKVTDITIDRINCSIAAKSTIWDKLKSDKWPDFMAEVYSEITKPQNGAWDVFIQDCINNSSGVKLKAFYGDLFGNSEMNMIARDAQYKSSALNEIVFKINGYEGGQFVIPVKAIFDRILVKYGINFITNSTVFTALNAYFQSRYFKLQFTGGGLGVYSFGYFRGFSNGTTNGVKSDKASKTVYDFVKEFIVHSGCLVDIIDDTNIALNRMDDLLTAPEVDFSGNIEKDSIKFSPAIDGIAQNNTIDFSEYSNKIQKGSLQLNIQCLNQNVETASQFLELKEFAPPAYLDRDKNVLGLFEDATWNNFTFLQDSGNTASYNCLAYFDLATELSTTKTLAIAKIMDVGYSIWAQMIQKPIKYTIKKWLTSADIKNIKLFQRYWIDELKGYYMLVKVNGLNPEKSNEATELEFIKIPVPHTYTNMLTTNITSITQNPTGGTHNLEITSNTFWTLTESLSWVSLSKSSGSLNDTVVITLTDNTTTDARTGTITLSSQDGSVVININITQSALKALPSTVSFSSIVSSVNLVITTTGDWTAVKSGDWFTINKTSGNGNDTIIVTKTLAYIADGSITITNGSVIKVITVTYLTE